MSRKLEWKPAESDAPWEDVQLSDNMQAAVSALVELSCATVRVNNFLYRFKEIVVAEFQRFTYHRDCWEDTNNLSEELKALLRYHNNSTISILPEGFHKDCAVMYRRNPDYGS